MAYKNKSDQKKFHANYDAAYYQRNKTKRIRQNAERKEGIRLFLTEVKSSLLCLRCGEDEPVCLDFHHRNSTEKDFVIGDAVRLGYSKKRILAEIAKCDVLCANCHRKLHASVA